MSTTTTVGPSVLDKHIQQSSRRPYVSRRAANKPVKSDAVYSRHYTSRSSSKDALVAKLNWLRRRAKGLFRRGPDPDEMRGRRRYRDWEYENSQLPRGEAHF